MDNEILKLSIEDQFYLNLDMYLMAVMKIFALMTACMFLFKILCILLWTSNFHPNRKTFNPK
jgi:hypothetical protein